MNVVIPPILFYAAGAMLVVFGVLRTILLGVRRESRELTPDTPARAKERSRHLTWGVVWVLLGLFLILSTTGVLRARTSL